jgi:hypothetical protein
MEGTKFAKCLMRLGCLGIGVFLLQIRALAWPAVLVGLVSQSARKKKKKKKKKKKNILLSLCAGCC